MTRMETLKAFAGDHFAALGMPHLAYVRPTVVDGTAAFAIHAADGTQIGLVETRGLAFALARQNDLEPVSVH